MRIFLTGASSFIGRTLIPLLIKQKHIITCAIRNKSTGMRKFSQTGCSKWYFDTLDARTDFTQALKEIDVVIHLASQVRIRTKSKGDVKREYMRVNADGTQNLAEQAAQQKVKRFVFISSMGVNGKSTKFCDVFNEENAENPYNDYTCSKLEAEKRLRALETKTGMEVVILRPPLVYGPGVKANFLKLLHLVGSGMPLPFAGIKNKRSFIAIDNLVDAIADCVVHEKAAGETFFVCDDSPLSTPEMIEKISREMGFRPRLFYFPSFFLKYGLFLIHHQEMYESLWGNMAVDSKKVHQYLGWRPRTSVDEGIRKTVQWYLENKSAK
jgi:UDP-glucose 4-epimerase